MAAGAILHGPVEVPGGERIGSRSLSVATKDQAETDRLWAARAMAAKMTMRKLDVAALQAAADAPTSVT